MKAPFRIAALAATAALASCTHLDTPGRLAGQVPLPSEETLFQAQPDGLEPWWNTFGSAELDELVDGALLHGFSIQEAWARMQQADAAARRARSPLRPALNLEAGGSHTRRGEERPSSSGVPSDTTESYSLALASAYELDLWGRVRNTGDAAALEAAAGREDFHTAAMSLAAQVADTWVRHVTESAQLDLLRAQLSTAETTLELLRVRFRNGIAGALDIYQQEQVVAGLEALMPAAEVECVALALELAVLTGQRPGVDLGLSQRSLPPLPPVPKTGVDADLLARRPDIRAAGQRLRAAAHRVDAARADRLPAIRLTARAGVEDDELSSLFDNWLANLAANLALPLLDAGNRRAEVDRSAFVTDERLAAYRRTVFEAIREVREAMAREAGQHEQLKALARQLDIARLAQEQARIRYQNGVSDYLPVLTQITTVQRLERDLLARQSGLRRYRIALYRALGGHWGQADTTIPSQWRQAP